MKWSIIGFAAVALAAVGVMDYHQKSRTAGLAFGTLSFSGYVGTIQAQYDGYKAGQARKKDLAALAELQKQGAKPYLPEAENGWQRRAFSEGDNSAISSPKREMADFEKQYIGEIEESAFSILFGANETTVKNQQDADSWVYAKDGSEILVRAKLVQPRRKDTMSGMAATMINNTMGAMSSRSGFAVVQGVAYAQVRSLEDLDSSAEKPSSGFRSFEAFLGVGQEVRITVRASNDTPDIDLFEILNAIDYVGMNRLLAHPVKGIGPDAPTFEREAQVAMAEIALETRQRILSMETKEVRDAMQNLDPLTMAVKQIQTQGATTERLDKVNAERRRPETQTDAQASLDKQASMALHAAPSDDVASMGWAEKLGTLAAIAGFGKSLDVQNAPTETASAGSRSECTMQGTSKRCRIVAE